MTEVSEGKKAERFVQSSVYKEAMENIEQGIIDQWKKCPLRDKEGQLYLKMMLKVKQDFELNIKKVIDRGKKAEFEIKRSPKQKIVNFISP